MKIAHKYTYRQRTIFIYKEVNCVDQKASSVSDYPAWLYLILTTMLYVPPFPTKSAPSAACIRETRTLMEGPDCIVDSFSAFISRPEKVGETHVEQFNSSIKLRDRSWYDKGC